MKFKLLVLVLVLALAGCADTVSFNIIDSPDPVGFWHGIWHGMTLPFAWFVSLFSDDTAIYAVYNNGGCYDFGFMIGVGGLSSSARSGKKS